MRFRAPSALGLATALALSAGALEAALSPEASFRAALGPNGLDYGGRAAYRTTLDRSLSAGGSRRLRAESGGILLRAASEPAPDAKAAARLLGEWRTRLYGQFEGAMSYPGMVTRRYDVPASLRPREVLPPGAGRAEWIVPATERLTFGAGAEDLVRYIAVVADLYCPAAGRAVEFALFYPRESFREEEALSEAAAFTCLRSSAPPAGAAADSWREPLERAERLLGEDDVAGSAAAAREAFADAKADPRLGSDESVAVFARLSRLFVADGAVEILPEMDARLSALKDKGFPAWLALGEVRRAEARPVAAEDALKHALAAKPGDFDAERELSAAYFDQSRFEEAAALLKEMIRRRPDDYFLYSRLAKADVLLGRLSEAKEALAEGRRVDGSKMGDYITEGYFFLNSRAPAEAEEAFENVIALDTGNPAGYHHMGTFLAFSRRYPEAEKYFRRAIEMMRRKPNAQASEFLPETLNRLGDAVAAQGRYAEAEGADLEGLKYVGPDGDVQLALLRSLAAAYVAQGKDAQAEATFKRADAECGARLKCRPDFAGGNLIDMGRFYLSRGRRAEAEAMARRAWDFSADMPNAEALFDLLQGLASFDADLGDAAGREAIHRRLLPLRRALPFDPDLIWVDLDSAAQASSEGRYAEAQDRYRRAIESLEHDGLQEREAGALAALAEACAKDGKPREASAARERAEAVRRKLPHG